MFPSEQQRAEIIKRTARILWYKSIWSNTCLRLAVQKCKLGLTLCFICFGSVSRYIGTVGLAVTASPEKGDTYCQKTFGDTHCGKIILVYVIVPAIFRLPFTAVGLRWEREASRLEAKQNPQLKVRTGVQDSKNSLVESRGEPFQSLSTLYDYTCCASFPVTIHVLIKERSMD